VDIGISCSYLTEVSRLDVASILSDSRTVFSQLQLFLHRAKEMVCGTETWQVWNVGISLCVVGEKAAQTVNKTCCKLIFSIVNL